MLRTPFPRGHGHAGEPDGRDRQGLRRRRRRPPTTRSSRSPTRPRPTPRRRRSRCAVLEGSLLSARQHRRLPRLLAARRRRRPSSSPSTTRPPRQQIEAGMPARGRRDRRRRRTRSPSGSAGTRPTSRRASGSSSSPARLGARVLRRPVELRLRARGARRPGRAPPAPPTRSTLALALTAFANAQGGQRQHHRRAGARADRRHRAECHEPALDHAGGARWLSSPPPSTRTSSCPDGGTDVNAIVTVTCAGAGTAGQTGGGAAGEIIIVDTSGSMGHGDDGGRQGRRPGGAGRDRRRHLVRGHRRLRPRRRSPTRPCSPARRWSRWTREPREAASEAIGRLPRLRRYGDQHLARPGRHRSSRRCPR